MIHLGKENSTTLGLHLTPSPTIHTGLEQAPALSCLHIPTGVAHEGHRGGAGGRGDKVGEGSEPGPADRAAQSQVSSGRVTSPIFKYNLSIPSSSSFLNSGKRHTT